MIMMYFVLFTTLHYIHMGEVLETLSYGNGSRFGMVCLSSFAFSLSQKRAFIHITCQANCLLLSFLIMNLLNLFAKFPLDSHEMNPCADLFAIFVIMVKGECEV
jgi:hypothetical protein